MLPKPPQSGLVQVMRDTRRAYPQRLSHHTGPVRCLALMPDGRSFVSGSDDMTVRIVDLQA